MIARRIFPYVLSPLRAALKSSILALVLTVLLACCAGVHAAPPDARTDYIDTTYTYNLGPTGARGWIYSTGNEWLFTPETLTTESRQIKVTRVTAGSPAAGILQVNDVILGASGTAAAPVDFTSDARKSLGLAIGEAEKTANAGVLKLKIWRSGNTQTVQLPLQVMGTYSATAPFNCPKSAAIIAEACTRLAGRPINSGGPYGDAVIGLALLACVSPTDPYYATVQTKVQTFARATASQYLNLTIPEVGGVAWPWGYTNVFLSEYYLATGDAQVLPAIRELSAKCATGQSLFGTYGHGMAWSKADGSSTHGYVPQYGALNQAGETVNLGMMLARKALTAAGDATVHPEIEPAIERGRKYFAYFAGKGAVPYGHSPPEDLHDDNGKNGLAALLMTTQTQADMSTEAKYFAKSCTAAYSLREMGHTGPFYAHLWQSLGANVGGPGAMSAYFKEIQWELDMVRRWDGAFVYHSATGSRAHATNPDNDAAGMGNGPDSDTASFLLTFATGLQKITITGKNQSAANHISAGDISEAITDGVFSLRTDLKTKTSDQLVGMLGSWSPQKRDWAAAELATRADANTKVTTLLAMAANTSDPGALNARKGGIQALWKIKPASAVTVLRDRLTDNDKHVRYYAAEALKAMGATALPVLNDMLTTIASPAHALPIEPIDWTDPCQIAYSYLGAAAFEGQLGNSVSGVSTSLLYPAITAMSQSNGRNSLINTFGNSLTATHVQALAPVITTALSSDYAICNEWLAKACIRTLSKYDVDEGIPAAMIFENQFSGRSWFAYGCADSLTALRKYGSKAAAVLPTLYYWNNNPAISTKLGMKVGDFSTTIAAIENDITAHTLLYFKTINTCTASPSTVSLPLGGSLLTATASDIDGNASSLVYTWSKFRGAGAVTFSVNGTTTSNNTIATFDTPGIYTIRLSLTDGLLDPKKYGPVTRDLTVTVLPDPNRAPVAANQNVTTPLNTAKTIILTATDADANPLTYSVVANPASGTLTGTPPALTYTPAAGFTGTTSFTFKANDGSLDSSIATVTITVGTSANATPVAQNQAVTTAEDTAKAITLAGTDADAGTTLTYTIVSPPAHGTVSGTGANRTYTPATNYSGADSFTFTVNDGTATSASAAVLINVTAVNDAPVALAQSRGTPESTVLPITLTSSDAEGYPVTYAITSYPTHGTLAGTVPNLTYKPATFYNGPDTLSFTVTDSEGVVSAVGTVSITVTPVNQAPVALNRSTPVTLNTATAIVLDGTDDDNDPLTYSVLSQPAHGVLTGTVPNLTYTPAAGYNSTDSFTFRVHDGTVNSNNIATIFLSVGTIYTGIGSEFYQKPILTRDAAASAISGIDFMWPRMASLTPDNARIDTQLQITSNNFPSGYADRFSTRHIAYLNITTAGNYTFTTGGDDNTQLWVDEKLVGVSVFPQSMTTAPLHLTAGYHAIRMEFYETYGDNYFSVSWKVPGTSNNALIPANVFFRVVGSTAPVVPANLSATPLDSAVALAWSPSPFATSYTVKRSASAGGPYTAFPDVTSTSFRDTTVTNGTTYYYVVTATGTGGTSFNSNEEIATPLTAPVTINLDYHPNSSIYMNGIASGSVADSGTASRVAPLDYDGVNASSTAVNFWNSGTDGNAALTNLKDSEGVTRTGVGVSAILVSHSASAVWGGLGVAPNGARLLKGGLSLSQSPDLASYKTLFKISGLDTTHRYDLALASQSNTDNRSTSYRVGQVEGTVQNGGGDSDWREGTTYAALTGLIPNAAGEIHLQAKVNSDWAPLNGWQLLDQGVRTAGTNAFTTIDSCSFGTLGTATVTESVIALTVPYGTALGTLTPTMVTAAGATISPTGPRNFASPIIYRVTAENGLNYQDYTVTITVAPNVTFTNTPLAVTATSSGAEILSTGALVEANHFFRYVVEWITLANGLTFGTDWTRTSPNGLSASHQRTDADAHNHVPLLTDATAFGKLMRSYAWSSSTTHYLDIPGLLPGHTYRLQLISSDGASARVTVEQATNPSSWTGTNRILTATWTQGPDDYVANVVLTRNGGEMEMAAYALHDVTPGFQPSPTGLVATAGDAQISLSWATAPGATAYTVKRSTVTGGPYTVIGNPTTPSFVNTGLSNGIRYYYVVSANSALGETPNSAQVSGLPLAPPAPPAGLTATPGNNTIGLTWSASSGATSYKVKRATTSGGPYTTLGSPSATSYTDATVLNGTTYFYVISAISGVLESANSGEVSAMPSKQASTTTLASSLGVTGPYNTAVTFTATVTSSATGTVAFMDGATVLGTGTLAAGTADFTTSALALGAHSITAAYGGDAGFSASASAVLPYAVSVKPVTITGVTASNKVYDGNPTAILSGGSVSGVAGGETVTVITGSGTFASIYAGTWAVTATGYALGGTHAGNYVLAAQPAVPNASITSNSGVTFSATALNVTATGTGAEILNTGTLVVANHFGGVSDGMSAIAPVTLNNGLTFGTSLTHMASGWSVHSTSTDAHNKVPLLTDANFRTLMRTYVWIAWANSVSSINIPGLTVGKSYRLQLISPLPANCAVTVEGGTATTWPGTAPSMLTVIWTAADTTANVVLTRTAGEIDFNAYALHEIIVPPPPAPTNLAATAGSNTVGLTWNASNGATGYKVKRATTSGGPFVTTLATTGTTSYTDATASNGTTYYYVVSATSSAGESPDSGQVSAQLLASPADLWRSSYFTPAEITAGLSTDEADPDHDGIVNLLERALNLGPKTATTTGLPTASLTTIGPDDYLTLTVNKSPVASDLTYTVEVSGTLNLWNSGPTHTTILDNTLTLLRVRDNTPISTGTRRFLRLRITGN